MSFFAKQTNRPFAIIGLLALLTVVVYIPSLGCGFIWDDDTYIVDNPTLRSVAGLGQIWFDFGATPDYYPLAFTTFWVEYQAWGLEPLGYHLNNVLLHALNVVLVFLLLTRLRVPGAFFAAALFAVHPVHVESVAWITERKNVLSGLCFLLSVWAFVHAYGLDGDEPAPRIHRRFYALSVGLFLLAMLSKTVTLTLPLILPVLIWWRTGRLTVRDLLLTLPFVAVAAPVVLLGFIGDANFGGAGVGVLAQASDLAGLDANGVGGQWDLTFIERFLLAGRVLWFYAGKLVWPLNLVFVYPRWTIDAGAWWQYLIALSAVAVPATFWYFRRKLGRGPLAAVLFYGLMLAPASGMLNFYAQRFSFVADHLQYLASLGIITLIAGTAGYLARRERPQMKSVRTAAMLAVPIVFAALSALQQLTYRDLKTLWISTLVKNPAAILARVNLASILLEEGDTAGALDLLNDGLHYSVQRNETVGIYAYLGEIHATLGQHEIAIRYLKSGLELDPECFWAHVVLATLLTHRGDTEAALYHYRQALDGLPHESEDARQLRATINTLRNSAARVGLSSQGGRPPEGGERGPPGVAD